MAQTKTANMSTFYANVQQNGYLRTTEQAQRLTRAVLWSLALNLGRGTKKSLAKALPDELAEYLTRPFWLVHFRDKTKSRDEFFKEVAKRSGNTDAQFAQHPTKAVFAEIKTLVDQDVVDDVADSLAPDIREFWEQA